MLFSNFDFLQQNFVMISKTFLDNLDSAIVSVLSHSWPPSVLVEAEKPAKAEKPTRGGRRRAPGGGGGGGMFEVNVSAGGLPEVCWRSARGGC